PSARLLTPAVTRGETLFVAVADAGAGVDPQSIEASVAGRGTDIAYSGSTGRASIRIPRLAPGRYRLVFTVSDYQEQKNTEDVGPILPNTRTLRATITVR